MFSGPGSVGPSAFSWSQVESLPGPGSRSVGPVLQDDLGVKMRVNLGQ